MRLIHMKKYQFECHIFFILELLFNKKEKTNQMYILYAIITYIYMYITRVLCI